MAFLSKFLGGTAAALIVAVGVSQSASANQIATWNPAGAGLVGTNITFDNFLLGDFATITLNAPSGGIYTATENAILTVDGLSLGGITLHDTAAHPNLLGGLNSTFGMYFQVSATASLTADGLGDLKGSFSSLTYTLYGYNIGLDPTAGNVTGSLAVNGAPTIDSNGAPVALATGTLNSANAVEIDSTLTPSANADVSFIPNLLPGFFVAPNDLTSLELITAFTNTSSVITTANSGLAPNVYEITDGGGNGTLAVPEPASLTVLGAGLAAFGLVRRNRKQG